MAAPRRWIRVDVTWSSSEWVIALPPGGRLAWIELLAYVKTTGAAGRAKAMSAKVAARRWDIPEADVQAMLDAARADGAIEAIDGDFVVTGWKEYQEPDPTASIRQHRRRVKEKTGVPWYVGKKCETCGSESDLTEDYIIPVSKGGTNDPSNLRVLCRRCNSSKHNNLDPVPPRVKRLRGVTRRNGESRVTAVTPVVTRHATETVTLTETETVTETGDRDPRAGASDPPDPPPAEAAHVEPNGADLGGFLDDLPEIAELVATMRHGNGAKATAATIRHRFLFPDGDGALADPIVRDLPFDRRRHLVHAALLEYATQPEPFERPLFTGFVKRLRDQPGDSAPTGIVKQHQPLPPVDDGPIDPAVRAAGLALVKQAMKATTPPIGDPVIADAEVIARREQNKAAAQRQLEQSREGAAS